MRFERLAKTIASAQPIALRPSGAAAGAGLDKRSNAHGIPAEIAFLSSYGVPPAQLIAAARLACRQGVSADRALLANGIVDETFFYQCLARHLGVEFIDEPVQLFDVSGIYRQAIHADLVPFKGASELAWLGAPRAPAFYHAHAECAERRRARVSPRGHDAIAFVAMGSN